MIPWSFYAGVWLPTDCHPSIDAVCPRASPVPVRPPLSVGTQNRLWASIRDMHPEDLWAILAKCGGGYRELVSTMGFVAALV